MWQPGGGGKNKKCHLSGNAEVVPVSEPPKKVLPVFECGKRLCHYLMITLKVVPLYDVNPFLYLWLTVLALSHAHNHTHSVSLFRSTLSLLSRSRTSFRILGSRKGVREELSVAS